MEHPRPRLGKVKRDGWSSVQCVRLRGEEKGDDGRSGTSGAEGTQSVPEARGVGIGERYVGGGSNGGGDGVGGTRRRGGRRRFSSAVTTEVFVSRRVLRSTRERESSDRRRLRPRSAISGNSEGNERGRGIIARSLGTRILVREDVAALSRRVSGVSQDRGRSLRSERNSERRAPRP